MKKYPLWLKAIVLVFFFGSMAGFVAFRSGAFYTTEGTPQGSATIPDSPEVKKRPTPGIYSTKSGRIIEPLIFDKQKPDSIIGSDAGKDSAGAKRTSDTGINELLKPEPRLEKKNSKNNSTIKEPMPSSKSGPVFPLE